MSRALYHRLVRAVAAIAKIQNEILVSRVAAKNAPVCIRNTKCHLKTKYARNSRSD